MAKAIAESKPAKPAPVLASTEPDISDVPTLPDEQKSAEELLSEFEKMLG